MIKRCPGTGVPGRSTLELIIRFLILDINHDGTILSGTKVLEKYFSGEIKIGNHDMKVELASVVYKSVGTVITNDISSITNP